MADDVLLDTNVVLRLLRADHPSHHAEARRLFEQAGAGNLRLIVPTLVVAEVVFVLQGYYTLSRSAIAQIIKDLAATPGVVVPEAGAILLAAELFGKHGIDFAHAYLTAVARETKTTTLATFNKKDFRRFSRLTLMP